MADKYNGVYPKAWSQRDVAAYEQFGREPLKTGNGLWVSDPEREERELRDWSLAELYALANNELYTRHQPGSGEFYTALRNKAILSDKDAIKWGEEDLYDWLLFEKPPAKSPNGYFINDPDRWVKDASTWNDSELVDLGCGYFGELERSQYYILDEACERFELPLGLTWDAYKTYIQDRTKPTVTQGGVLVESRTRATTPIAEWSEAEVKAWLFDEIADPRESDLLECARTLFAGEWYWQKAHLRQWVETEEIPEVQHDYDSYTEDQLKRLIRDEADDGALDCLAGYHLDELHDDWSTEERRAYLLDGVVPEVVAEAEAEPEPEPEVVEVVPEVLEPAPEEQVDEVPDVEVEPPVPELLWTDLVGEDSVLYKVLTEPTPEEILATAEGRQMRTASRWTLQELVAWARDEIDPGLNATVGTLTTALRVHCGTLVENWTDGAVKAFIAHQTLPEGLAEGMLVEDTRRDRKHPGDWSDEELIAWAKGKIRCRTVPEIEVLMTLRVRFKVPGRLNDDEAKHFVITGECPVEVIPDITDPRLASDAQIDAWLNGDLTVDERLEPALFQVVRVRRQIDKHWTDSHILAHHRLGTLPRTNDEGVLLEDRMRTFGSAAEWTWKELRAWHRDEISAGFSVEAGLQRVRHLITLQFGHKAMGWSDEEVLTFLVSEVKPRALENGVYINDPTRSNRAATEWSQGELEAWLDRKIESTDKVPTEALWDEVYSRFGVPLFWYAEDARSYVLKRHVVPSTPTGIWIRDWHRDMRPAKHWTRREIKAWARGQILPGIQASEEQLVYRAARLFGVSLSLDNASIKERIANITEESMTMTVKFVHDDLASYANGRMEAGNNAIKAAPYQTLLDRCISRVLRLDGEDFVQGWTELLNFFFKHSNGITSAKKMYIGVGQMAITPKGLRNFQHLTAILTNTCNPKTRDRAVALIEWSTALQEIPNEKARQQLLAYYGK